MANLLSPLAHFTAALGKSAHIPNIGISYALDGGPSQGIHPGLLQNGRSGQGTNSSIYNNPAYNKQMGDNPDGSLKSPGAGTSAAVAGGGGGTAGVNNGASLAAARNNIFGDQNTINGLYSAINGQIGALAAQNTATENNNFDAGNKANETAFNTAVDSTNGAYGARGAGDSSYESNDNIASDNNLQSALQSALTAHNQNLGAIGNWVSTNQAAIAKPTYNLSDYNDVGSLTDLHNQLGQYIQTLQGAKSTIGNTNAQNLSTLQSTTPITSNLQSQLTARLNNLASSNASPAAKVGLAQGYLNEAGVSPTDGNYSDLLKKLGLNTAAPAST